MERKEFLQLTAMLSLGSTLSLNLLGCGENEESLELMEPIEVDLSSTPFTTLNIEGEWILHPDVNVLLVNVNGAIRAFSSVCPHQRCTRDWNYTPGVFTCTCHTSKFDATGQYLSGPARENLRQLSVTVDGDTLTVGG